MWQWNEIPILWVWAFCLISGERKLEWGNNMLLFRYSSSGGGGEAQRRDAVQRWKGDFCVRGHLKWPFISAITAPCPRCINFPHSPLYKSSLCGSFWLSQASVLRHQPRSRHFCGAGFPWQREPRWNSSASLWWLTFTALPHPLGKSVFY